MTGDKWITSPKDVMATRFRIAQQNPRRESMDSPPEPLGLDVEESDRSY